jgi:hypothetical protein
VLTGPRVPTRVLRVPQAPGAGSVRSGPRAPSIARVQGVPHALVEGSVGPRVPSRVSRVPSRISRVPQDPVAGSLGSGPTRVPPRVSRVPQDPVAGSVGSDPRVLPRFQGFPQAPVAGSVGSVPRVPPPPRVQGVPRANGIDLFELSTLTLWIVSLVSPKLCNKGIILNLKVAQ